jgi:phosphate transport system protein
MTSADRIRDEEPVAQPDPSRGTPSFEEDLAALKQKLITMAGRVENMVNQAIKGFLLRQEDLGVRIKREDAEVNRFEMDIDELAVQLLEKVTRQQDRRLLVVAMKISGELERVGDEATTIARRAQELTREPFRESAVELLAITTLALGMFEDALGAFTTRDPARARLVIPRDAEVDFLHKGLHRELMNSMMAQPALIPGCLHIMVISKSLERIADHATNVAEEVVYLYEGQDIRHGGKTAAAKV